MEKKSQAKQKQAMSEEEMGAGTGHSNQTPNRHVSVAGLCRGAPGQVTVARTSLRTTLVVMNQWYLRQSIARCRRQLSPL